MFACLLRDCCPCWSQRRSARNPPTKQHRTIFITCRWQNWARSKFPSPRGTAPHWIKRQPLLPLSTRQKLKPWAPGRLTTCWKPYRDYTFLCPTSAVLKSEERRVGKESRARGSRAHQAEE